MAPKKAQVEKELTKEEQDAQAGHKKILKRAIDKGVRLRVFLAAAASHERCWSDMGCYCCSAGGQHASRADDRTAAAVQR